MGFTIGAAVKNLSVMQKTQETPWVQSLGPEDPLEEGMATHSSILALENPMDRGAWQGTVHSIAQSQTQLKWLSLCVHTFKYFKKIGFMLYSFQIK